MNGPLTQRLKKILWAIQLDAVEYIKITTVSTRVRLGDEDVTELCRTLHRRGMLEVLRLPTMQFSSRYEITAKGRKRL